ncbi:MAG: subtilisin family serine protease [Rhodothermales bacterium]|jgi:subtilisin family serine protease
MLPSTPHTRTWMTALVVVLGGCEPAPVDRLSARSDLVFAIAEQPSWPAIGSPAAWPEEPWGVERVGGSAAVDGAVCIIDSGVDLNHPDLNVDVANSRSFIRHGPEKGDPMDRNGHGTHVAGIIGAKDNGFGVTGIASGATIVAVKVVDAKGLGYTRDVIAGIQYVSTKLKNGKPLCDVVNFSIGAVRDPAVDKAVVKASRVVPFVLSAGNQGLHVRHFSPARVDAKRVYTVTAIAEGDRWPMFSNYGSGTIDFAAPGVHIRSTWKESGYKVISGTSSAAAHVSAMILRGGAVPDGLVMDPRGQAYVIPVSWPAEAAVSVPAIAGAAATRAPDQR